MKKVITLILVLAIILSAIPAFALGEITIIIDGTKIEPVDANGNPVKPFVLDGTTYLPVRAVAEALNFDVEWDGDTRTVMIGEPGAAQLGDEINIMINGTLFTARNGNGLIVYPLTVNGSVYLPVRAVASALGKNVDWDQATQTVTITTPTDRNASRRGNGNLDLDYDCYCGGLWVLHAFVVSSYTVDVAEDGKNVINFRGLQNGCTRTFSLYDDVDGYADQIAENNDIAKGTILLVGPEYSGYVDEIEFLVKVTKIPEKNAIDKIEDLTDEAASISGEKKFVTDFSWVVPDDETRGYYSQNRTIQVEGYETEGGYKPGNYRKVVLVDLTPSRHSAVTVSSRDITALDVDNEKYSFAIFFRACDVDNIDEFDLNAERSHVHDIVLYKFNKDEEPVIK